MQHTTINTTASTIQAIIDKLFDYFNLKTIEEELYECVFLAQTQSEGNDKSLESDAISFTTIRSTINFITELEKYSSTSTEKKVVDSGINLSFKQNIVFPFDSDSKLRKLINGYYKKHTARAVTFSLWDNYVSAIGNDKAEKWTACKQSNVAFLTMHLNEMILDLERFRSNGIFLS